MVVCNLEHTDFQIEGRLSCPACPTGRMERVSPRTECHKIHVNDARVCNTCNYQISGAQLAGCLWRKLMKQERCASCLAQDPAGCPLSGSVQLQSF